MSRTVHGILQPDRVLFNDLPECISYHAEPISSGEHAGQVALTIINADNPDCEDIYYGELNSANMEFEVVIPDTEIFITGGQTYAANVWKLDISSKDTSTWLENHFYDPSFYVVGTGSKTTLEFTAGGTREITEEMIIYGAISGASAEVYSVELTSGTWAGGDAAGTLTLINQSGEFIAENLRLDLHSITLIHRLPNYETIYWVTSLLSTGLDTGNTVLITEAVNFNGAWEATVVDTEKFQIDVPPPRHEDETSGSCAIYLAAVEGNSSMVEVSGIYHCILGHISTADNRPTAGVNWKEKWELHDCVWKAPLHSNLCRKIVVDTEGNVYVVGDRINGKTVWKFNPAGGLIWSYDTGEFIVPGLSGAYGIAVDSAGNIYVVGRGIEGANVWKIDKFGTLLWTYNTEGYATSSVAVGANGIVYVGGYQYDNKNIWKLHNIDTPPLVELIGSYNTGEGDPACVHSIALDAAGKVYAAGDRVDIGSSVFRTVWKLNWPGSSGSIIWSFDTGAFDEAKASSIAIDSVGNVYVGGTIGNDVNGTFKLDSSGNKVWDVPTGGNCVAVDSDDIPYTAWQGTWKLDSSNGDTIWTYFFTELPVIYGITVTNLWKRPTGHNDPDNLWVNAIAVYDGSLLSSALSSCEGTWGSFLELLIPPAVYDKIRFYAVFEGATNPKVDIDIYYDGGWHDIYEGIFNQSELVEKPIPAVGPLISKARIRFSSTNNADIELTEFGARISNVHVAGKLGGVITTQKISVCCGVIWSYKTIGDGEGIVLDTKGNIFIASGNSGNKCISKLDRCGNLIWDTLTPDTVMNAMDITVDADGNVYCVSISWPANANVWKIDNLGNVLWTYFTGDAALGIAVDKAKRWYVNTVYTTTQYTIGDDNKTYHCKLNHTSSDDDRPVTGENWGTYWELADVNVYVVGERVDNKNVRKLSSSGGLLWSADTKGVTYGVVADKDGNVFVVGERVYDEGTWKSVWKFNSSGVLIGSYDTGGDTYGIAIDDDGNIYIAGDRVYDEDYKNIWKLDNSLGYFWSYDTEASCELCITIDADGNIYIGGVGNEHPVIPGFPTIFVLDSFGDLIWGYDTAENEVTGIAINN